MSPLVQEAIVAFVVAAAVIYALLRLTPRGLRTALAHAIANTGLRFGLSESNARRVEAKLVTGGACGSCDDCKACATPVEPTPSARRVIPIRSSGR